MREMSRSAAPGEVTHPALALVNSRRRAGGGVLDELERPEQLREWLCRHGLWPEGTRPAQARARELQAVRALRDAARELLAARIEHRVPDQGAVEAVNEAAAAAPTARRLHWTHAGEPEQLRDCLGAGGLALARSLIAADVIELVTGPEHSELLACGAPGCVRLLLRDHPRRQWCSTACGDRVRASRYYQRRRARDGHRGEPGSPPGT